MTDVQVAVRLGWEPGLHAPTERALLVVGDHEIAHEVGCGRSVVGSAHRPSMQRIRGRRVLIALRGGRRRRRPAPTERRERTRMKLRTRPISDFCESGDMSVPAESIFFDLWSATYDRPGLQQTTYRPIHDAVLARLDGLEPDRVLDLGCGTGQLTERSGCQRFPTPSSSEPTCRTGCSNEPPIGSPTSTPRRSSARTPNTSRSPTAHSTSSRAPSRSTGTRTRPQPPPSSLASFDPGGRVVIASIAAVTGFADEAIQRATALAGRPVRAIPKRRAATTARRSGIRRAAPGADPAVGLRAVADVDRRHPPVTAPARVEHRAPLALRIFIGLIGVGALLFNVVLMISDRAPGITRRLFGGFAQRLADRLDASPTIEAGDLPGNDAIVHIGVWAVATTLVALTLWRWSTLIPVAVAVFAHECGGRVRPGPVLDEPRRGVQRPPRQRRRGRRRHRRSSGLHARLELGQSCASRKSTTASVNTSLRSPATMCPAPATSAYSRVRDEPEELLRAFLRQQVALTSADEQRRDRQAARRVLERTAALFEVDDARLVAVGVLAPHEGRVPVPVPPPVSEPDVLLEPREVGRAWPMRVVGLDRIGDLVERPESGLDVFVHERSDAVDARRFDVRCDVDEDERTGDVPTVPLSTLMNGHQGRRAAEGGTDEDRADRNAGRPTRRRRERPNRRSCRPATSRCRRDRGDRPTQRGTRDRRVPATCRPTSVGSGRRRGTARRSARRGLRRHRQRA